MIKSNEESNDDAAVLLNKPYPHTILLVCGITFHFVFVVYMFDTIIPQYKQRPVTVRSADDLFLL